MAKIFMNWSSGKDSAMALNRLIKAGQKPELLLTILGKEEQRIGMHGLRKDLLEQQVEAIGIPLKIIELSKSLDHEEYNQLMSKTCLDLKEQGFDTAAFGDIFLEDLRNYREAQLAEVGIKSIFPLWQENTKTLIEEFMDEGFESIIVAAAEKHFEESFLGTEIKADFIDQLPKEVDPCGEYGEFHSFCFNGPIFAKKVPFKKGERFYKTYPNPNRKEEEDTVGFYFMDLFSR